VVVENFRGGVMDRLGLGYERLSAQHPQLIFCSISGFGAGAGSALPGYDLLVQAVGGLMSVTGDPDSEPQKVGVALVDVVTGLFAGIGVLAALRHRETTGTGQRVDVDLLSCLLAALVNHAAAYTVGGVVPTRMGNRHHSIAPYEPVPARNGEVVLAVGNDRQFAALCEALDAPQLARDERFATNALRVVNREALFAALKERFALRDVAEVSDTLLARGVPAGAVNDIAGAFGLAERLGLQPIVEVPRGDGTTVPLPRNPIGLSATPPTYRSAPPALPEQSDARLAWEPAEDSAQRNA
jgi:crotonobetainyl-CoA:carnitine CoA-transferase CaiB-like acyl-CoA transferase